MAKVENGKKKGRHKGERHIEDTRMWRGWRGKHQRKYVCRQKKAENRRRKRKRGPRLREQNPLQGGEK